MFTGHPPLNWILSYRSLSNGHHRKQLLCTYSCCLWCSPRFCSRSSSFQHLHLSYCLHCFHFLCSSAAICWWLTTSHFSFPSNFLGQIDRLEDCLTALHAWCCHNSLSLNPDISDSALFETRQRSHSFSGVTTVSVAGSVVPMADHVSTRRHTRQSPVDGQAREQARQSHMFLSCIYVHCDTFDQPSPSAMPTWLRLSRRLAARLRQRQRHVIWNII